jgi:uncharacterized protein (TIGR01440 family)
MDEKKIEQQIITGLTEYFEQSDLAKESIFVLGCSSSEVLGGKIGKQSSKEIGQLIVSTVHTLMKSKGIYLAVQACEHLNRALVVEKRVAQLRNLEIVSVVPALHAGGAAALAAYERFTEPVMVEKITGEGGMDIGDTAIGMHVKHVQVPVRTTIKEIGQAHTTYLKSRPKLIGGSRALYD